MKRLVVFGLALCSCTLFAQVNEWQGTVGIGGSEATVSVLYGHDWEFGKRKQFAVGVGGRITSYFGANRIYRTAPAKLTSGETGLLVIFKPDIEANIDTLILKSPQVNSINAFVNLRYSFSDKFQVGFNIDLIGFSFGGSTRGTYINGAQGGMDNAKPSSFNVLLTSDNDLGSLNSELYAKYYLNDRWGLKAGAQFHFTEYTTDSKIQQLPEPNDRFRRKSLLLALGVTYKL